MLNSGQLEVHADILPGCPPEDQVIQNYEQLITNGDIRDWRAMCKKVTFDDQGT
jgi:coenzyme F420-reducing hydrogenase gamma subunit